MMHAFILTRYIYPINNCNTCDSDVVWWYPKTRNSTRGKSKFFGTRSKSKFKAQKPEPLKKPNIDFFSLMNTSIMCDVRVLGRN